MVPDDYRPLAKPCLVAMQTLGGFYASLQKQTAEPNLVVNTCNATSLEAEGGA